MVLPLEELAAGVASFRGVYRRFDRLIDDPRCVLIDDYAHHPNELDPSIRSVRELYPDRKILGIFQPHLYSRTQDSIGSSPRALTSSTKSFSSISIPLVSSPSQASLRR